MRLVRVRVLTRAFGVAAVAAGLMAVAGPAQALPIQAIGVDYSGFACPLTPVHAKAGAATTLVITTTTNFSTSTTFSIPSMNIRVTLPLAFSSQVTHVDLGVLRPGSVQYRIDAPPMTGSYGWSCQGAIDVS